MPDPDPEGAPVSDEEKPAVPNKVCPHCGAMNQTVFEKCPSCGKKYKKRSGFKTFAIVAGAGLLVLIVAIVGCAALIGVGVEEATDEAQEHAISRAEFNSVEQGTTQGAIEKRFGEPEDSQEFEQKFGGQVTGSSCIYYNETGQELFEGDSYQFCFTEGRLDSKNAY